MQKNKNINDEWIDVGDLTPAEIKILQLQGYDVEDNGVVHYGSGGYVVKKGDSLSAIARANGTTVAELLKANPQIKSANTIYAGATINIPGVTVGSGDTLSSIARKYNTTVASLLEANPQIKDKNTIYKGTTLNLPGSSTRENVVIETKVKPEAKTNSFKGSVASAGYNNPSTIKATTDYSVDNVYDQFGDQPAKKYFPESNVNFNNSKINNKGVKLRAKKVGAFRPGVVTQAIEVDGRGAVLVDAGDGNVHVYNNLSTVNVKVGDKINEGTYIGDAAYDDWADTTGFEFQTIKTNTKPNPGHGKFFTLNPISEFIPEWTNPVEQFLSGGEVYPPFVPFAESTVPATRFGSTIQEAGVGNVDNTEYAGYNESIEAFKKELDKMKARINSPTYLKRLQKEGYTLNEAKEIVAYRLNRLNTTPVNVWENLDPLSMRFVDSPSESYIQVGPLKNKTNRKVAIVSPDKIIGERDFDPVEVFRHEEWHNATKAEKGMSESAKQKLTASNKDFSTVDDKVYYGNSSERYVRMQELQNYLEAQGIKQYAEDMTPVHLKKLMDIYNSGKMPESGAKEFLQRTKEEYIIDLLNNIAAGQGRQGVTKAAYGGQIQKFPGGGEARPVFNHKGELLLNESFLADGTPVLLASNEQRDQFIKQYKNTSKDRKAEEILKSKYGNTSSAPIDNTSTQIRQTSSAARTQASRAETKALEAKENMKKITDDIDYSTGETKRTVASISGLNPDDYVIDPQLGLYKVNNTHVRYGKSNPQDVDEYIALVNLLNNNSVEGHYPYQRLPYVEQDTGRFLMGDGQPRSWYWFDDHTMRVTNAEDVIAELSHSTPALSNPIEVLIRLRHQQKVIDSLKKAGYNDEEIDQMKYEKPYHKDPFKGNEEFYAHSILQPKIQAEYDRILNGVDSLGLYDEEAIQLSLTPTFNWKRKFVPPPNGSYVIPTKKYGGKVNMYPGGGKVEKIIDPDTGEEFLINREELTLSTSDGKPLEWSKYMDRKWASDVYNEHRKKDTKKSLIVFTNPDAIMHDENDPVARRHMDRLDNLLEQRMRLRDQLYEGDEIRRLRETMLAPGTTDEDRDRIRSIISETIYNAPEMVQLLSLTRAEQEALKNIKGIPVFTKEYDRLKEAMKKKGGFDEVREVSTTKDTKKVIETFMSMNAGDSYAVFDHSGFSMLGHPRDELGTLSNIYFPTSVSDEPCYWGTCYGDKVVPDFVKTSGRNAIGTNKDQWQGGDPSGKTLLDVLFPNAGDMKYYNASEYYIPQPIPKKVKQVDKLQKINATSIPLPIVPSYSRGGKVNKYPGGGETKYNTTIDESNGTTPSQPKTKGELDKISKFLLGLIAETALDQMPGKIGDAYKAGKVGYEVYNQGIIPSIVEGIKLPVPAYGDLMMNFLNNNPWYNSYDLDKKLFGSPSLRGPIDSDVRKSKKKNKA